MRRINEHRAISQFRSPATMSGIALNEDNAQSAIVVGPSGGPVHYRDIGLVSVGHLTNNFISGDQITISVGSKASGGENAITNTFKEGIILGTLGLAQWVIQGIAMLGEAMGAMGAGISNGLASALSDIPYQPSIYGPEEIGRFIHSINSRLSEAEILQIVKSLMQWVPARGLPMDAFLAMMYQESSFNPRTVNHNSSPPTTDYGLCQLNSQSYGHGPELFDIETNIRLGTEHYRGAYLMGNGNIRSAYAIYNSGQGNWRRGTWNRRNVELYMGKYNEVKQFMGR